MSPGERFLKRAKDLHGVYDYSKSVYGANAHNKIVITCQKHGDFLQTPAKHLYSGQGCPKCGKERSEKGRRGNSEDFIRKARSLHGRKYDYSAVRYTTARNKVSIICARHGEFRQTPNGHLKPSGCPDCGFDSISQTKRQSLRDWIEKANSVHGGKYDYSLTKRPSGRKRDSRGRVTIICPEHGKFTQAEDDHISGFGCQSCRFSHGERAVQKWLDSQDLDYFAQFSTGPFDGQTYDFLVPELNLAIEVQGEQHFKPVKFFGGEYKFKIQMKRDANKRLAARKSEITLMEIPYLKSKSLDRLLSSIALK